MTHRLEVSHMNTQSRPLGPKTNSLAQQEDNFTSEGAPPPAKVVPPPRPVTADTANAHSKLPRH